MPKASKFQLPAQDVKILLVSSYVPLLCMPKTEAEVSRLRAENEKLKALLAAHGIAVPVILAHEPVSPSSQPSRTSPLPPQAKVKLFRSLFQGRDDVYPIRWESKQTGKVGYSPVCANEWRSGICEKPRIKCADCRGLLKISL